MCGGLEHLSSAGRLGEPGLPSLESSRVRGGLTAASQCLKRAESDGKGEGFWSRRLERLGSDAWQSCEGGETSEPAAQRSWGPSEVLQ